MSLVAVAPSGRDASFTMKVDTMFTAIGEEGDMSPFEKMIDIDGTLIKTKNESGETSARKVFAGGDVVTGPRASSSHKRGRKAAERIGRMLSGAAEPVAEEPRTISIENINTAYFTKARRVLVPRITVAEALKGYREIFTGFDGSFCAARPNGASRAACATSATTAGYSARMSPSTVLRRIRIQPRLLQGLSRLRNRMPAQRHIDAGGGKMKKVIMGTTRELWRARERRQGDLRLPITPQTQIVELLSEMCAKGELDAKFIAVESEHSALTACVGASAAGVRTFTATSSQGLLLMHEIIHWAVGPGSRSCL